MKRFSRFLLASMLAMGFGGAAQSQCNLSGTNWQSASAPYNCTTYKNATTCAYFNEYTTFTGLTVGESYTVQATFSGGTAPYTLNVYSSNASGSAPIAYSTGSSSPMTVVFTATTSTVYVKNFSAGCTSPGNTCHTFGIKLTNCPAAPANDNCANATAISNTGGSGTGTTIGATQSLSGCTGTADDDVWYTFTPASGQLVTITATPAATGAISDIVLNAFQGAACPTTSTPNVGCADATGSTGTETVSFISDGSPVRFRVYSYASGSGQGAFTYSVTVAAPAAPPANDNCAGAYPLTVNANYDCGSVTAGTVAGATASPQSATACAGTEEDDVWFSFVATATTHRISILNAAGNTTDMYHSLWTGADCNSLALVTGSCSDVDVSNPTGLTIGQTYYVRVYTYYSAGPYNTTFNVCVGTAPPPPPPPANDDCSGAIALTAGTTCNYQTFTNTAATASTGAPAPGCASYNGGDVWFTATADASGNLIVNTNTVTGGFTDGGMAAYSGSCGSLTLIECDDDDSENGLMPRLDLTGLSPNQVVYIRVWEFGGDASGQFSICASYPVPPPPPPANNNCPNATALVMPTPTANGTTIAATASLPDDCNGAADDDVWYTFTPVAGSSISITAVPSGADPANDLVLQLFAGACPTTGSGTESVACVDETGTSSPEVLTYIAPTPAVPMYVRVYTYFAGADQQGEFTISVNPEALVPIDLVSFTGIKASETLNKLEWNVSCSDNRPNTIELQRSNTNGNFTKIYSVVTSPANCGSAFDYNDAAPLNGNNYYRLKMVDADGVIKYSHVVLLNNSVKGAGNISVSPNPAKDVTTVRINSLESKAVTLKVVDATGRTVVRQNASLVAGTNNIRLDVSRLSAGMYQVVISDKSGVLNTLKLSRQ